MGLKGNGVTLPSFIARCADRLPVGWQRLLRRQYRTVRDGAKLVAAAAYDARNYARGSGLLGNADREVLKTRIIKSYHRIEKGLALPMPRPGFGVDAITLLIDDSTLYLSRHGGDWTTTAALQALDQYCVFNRAHGRDTRAIEERITTLRQLAQPLAGEPVLGGVMQVDRRAVLAAAQVPFAEFVRHRHSVRQFASRPVDTALIEEAVRQAQYSPSVCNREGVQVYVIEGEDRVRELLAYQNGNRGFGDSAGAVLVITARQAAFHTVGERYQAWIDGGLFAMTLVYALHAQGLGTCCLNWSVEPTVDRAFKRAAGLPPHDVVVMFLAVGHLPDHFTVARSARRPLSEVLHRL